MPRPCREAPVRTAITPGIRSASDVWISAILAWGTGLRTTVACAMPGIVRLMVRSSVPMTRSRASTIGVSGKETSVIRRPERLEGPGDEHADHFSAVPGRAACVFHRIYRIGVNLRHGADRSIIESSSRRAAANLRPPGRSRSHRSHHYVQFLDGVV